MSSIRRIARNTGVQWSGEVLGKAASLAFYLVMARALGTEGFGDFNFALSLAIMLTVFAGLGMDQILTRDASRDPEQLHHLFWNSIAIKAALGGLGVVAAVGVAVVGGYGLELELAVAILGAAALIEIISKTVYATFQAHEDMAPVAASFVLQRFSTAVAGIAAMTLGAGLLVVAAIYLAGAVIALAYASARLWRRGVRPARRISGGHARDLAIGSLGLGLSAIFGAIIFRVDAIMLSLIKGNVAVGFYAAPVRLLESTLFLSFAFVAAAFPILSRLSRDTKPTIGEAYTIAAKGIVTLLLPIGIVFVLFAEPVITLLYGEDYSPSVSALQLLGGAAAFYGLGYLGSYVLIAQDRLRAIPWIMAAAVVANIALNLLLIPRFSFDGAAAATSASEATMALLFAGFAIAATGPISYLRIFTAPAIGCVGMAMVRLGLGASLPALAVAVVAYAALLLIVERRLFPADFHLIAGALGRRGRRAETERA